MCEQMLKLTAVATTRQSNAPLCMINELVKPQWINILIFLGSRDDYGSASDMKVVLKSSW